MVRAGTAWRKNNRREIRRTLGRYLAIVMIVALGVGFFVGLKLAKPAMIGIGREFVQTSALYDFQLISTIGLTQEDVSFFSQLDGVLTAEGSVSADLLTTVNENQVVFKTHQLLNQINKVQLTAGRMPQAANECLADDLVFTQEQLGMVLPVENEEGDSFSQASYTVVGLCNSAQYLNVQRGSTALADGSVSGFLYLMAEGYDSPCYTEAYLQMRHAPEAFSETYQEAMGCWESLLQEAMEQRGALRADSVYEEAAEELKQAQEAYEVALAAYQEARADTDAKLEEVAEALKDGEKQLADGEKALKDGEKQLEEMEKDPYSNAQLAQARQQLEDGKKQLEEGERQYQLGLAEYQSAKEEAQPQLDEAKKQLEAAQQELDDGWAQYRDGVRQYEDGKRQMQLVLAPLNQAVIQAEAELQQAQQTLAAAQRQLDSLRQDPDANAVSLAEAAAAVEAARVEVAARQVASTAARQVMESTTTELNASLQEGERQLLEGRKQLEEGQKQYDAGMKEYEDNVRQLEDAGTALETAAAQLAASRSQLENGQRELEAAIETALKEGKKKLKESREQLAQARREYEEGLAEYEDGVKTADAEFSDARAQLEDGKRQLEDAEKQVEALKNPSYYVLNREANSGYASFENDTSIVDNVAKIFPIFFFLVAAMVCSSTMTRMVEEQRTQNGTLKALGYSDGQILWRYASYAGSAAMLGATAGYFLCAWLFPRVIWQAYQMLYHFGEIRLVLDGKLAVISVAFALLCSVGAACAAAWSEMRPMPAKLMRPKAPKAGKRVFLEYITPVWKRMSFLQKVAIRNILRYKKRLAMILLGVGGCMALLIAGMGMRDSISNVAEEQYSRIAVYDYAVTFRDGHSEEQQQAFRTQMGDRLTDCAFADVSVMDVLTRQGTKSANVVASNDPQMGQLFHLYCEETELGYPSDEGVFVSRKLAELADIQVGDTISVQTADKHLVELPVEGIVENYVQHYIFLTQRGYESWFDQELSCQTAFAATAEPDVYAVAAQLQNTEDVVNVSITQSFRDMVGDMLVSLDAVIVLVVGCAVALSFVVSYNLCNINITERVREIATIKVLGFYDRETYEYIFRESVTLTALGVLVGIPMGIWLHRFILDRIQVDMVSFPMRISWLSYVLAVILTFAINLMVDLLLRKKIDRVHPAESLKSVE